MKATPTEEHRRREVASKALAWFKGRRTPVELGSVRANEKYAGSNGVVVLDNPTVQRQRPNELYFAKRKALLGKRIQISLSTFRANLYEIGYVSEAIRTGRLTRKNMA